MAAQAIQPVGKALKIAYDIHSSGFLYSENATRVGAAVKRD